MNYFFLSVDNKFRIGIAPSIPFKKRMPIGKKIYILFSKVLSTISLNLGGFSSNFSFNKQKQYIIYYYYLFSNYYYNTIIPHNIVLFSLYITAFLMP